MFDTEIDRQLTNDIKEYFGCFNRDIKIMGMPLNETKQLSLKEVALITFASGTPLSIAKNFFEVLLKARDLMNGKDETFKDEKGNPYKFPEHRILFILGKTGLTILID